MKGYARWAVFCLGALAFLAPWKFCAPVPLQDLLMPPDAFWDWAVHSTWPNQLANIFALAALLWLVLDSERIAARVDLLFVLPVIFLATQLAAVPASIAPQTSADTVMAFAVDVLLFYAAAWYVRDGAVAGRIFGALGLATLLIVVKGLVQHFGELQATREYAAAHLNLAATPADYMKRLNSDRVFAWFFGYPNALAGFLVLAFAPTLAWIWVRGRTWLVWVKWATLMLAGGVMMFCLLLTGSRGGVVAFAAAVMAGLFCFVSKGRARWVLIALAAITGIFVLAQRGGLISLRTESVAARGDYWRGAIAIARDHPWLGTGPGTFGSIYPKYKTAATEEAQFVHNNFLQMWSDSGLPAFLAFALLWLVALRDAFALARQRPRDAAAIAVCAALAGWTVHGLVDFDLYVPGVAMPAFVLLGILQGLKDLPEVRPVEPRRPMLAVVCLAVVAGGLWMEGRSLMASVARGRMLQLDASDPAAALVEVRRSIELSPNNALYHSAAGDLAVRLDRFAEAAEHYRAAIECDPYRGSYHWRLARVLAATGQAEEALEQLRIAQSLNPTKERYRKDLAAAEESVRQAAPILLESAPTTQQELDSPAVNQ